jgi:hypothetical protein
VEAGAVEHDRIKVVPSDLGVKPDDAR